MIRFFYYLSALFFICLFFLHETAHSILEDSSPVLKINILSNNNGVGLETDQKIIKKALEQLGHSVQCFDYYRREETKYIPKADINIFFEALFPEYFFWADVNWFVPNPEWYYQDLKFLEKVDLILCRTQEVSRIFKNLHAKTYFLGFTSPDCFSEKVEKDYGVFAHLAGASVQKGTETISNLWKLNPYFPLLNLVYFKTTKRLKIQTQKNLKWITTRLSKEAFIDLQNHCGVHLCLSETEGFGHYISEAMSTGAVILTTDAPPMNEFITDPRFLVAYHRTAPQNQAINYYVDPKDLKKKIEDLKTLSLDELKAIGLSNRGRYLKNKAEFHENLAWLMEQAQLEKIAH